MGEMKHTPGPWRVDEEVDEFVIVGRPEWPCRRNGISGEWDVATVADLGFDHDEAGPEALANARLIASAPDLLEALLELVEACEADCGTPAANDADDEAVGFTMHGPMATTFGMLRRARAALSKAEGRSLSSASGQEGGE